MNHELVAKALCGRYVKLADGAGYLESNLTMPDDGALIGAYVRDLGDGHFLLTDDGDVTFRAAVSGAEITRNRAKRYAAIAAAHGLEMAPDGTMRARCDADQLAYILANFVQAAHEIAVLGVKHRPKDTTRFERLVGVALESSYVGRIQRKPFITGISGHQLQFPYGLDMGTARPVLIQPVAGDGDGRIAWKNVYEAGGKFADVRGARSDVRLVAVMEDAKDAAHARRYFADKADVIVYDGGDLALAA